MHYRTLGNLAMFEFPAQTTNEIRPKNHKYHLPNFSNRYLWGVENHKISLIKIQSKFGLFYPTDELYVQTE